MGGDIGVTQQMAILPAVGAGGMQANQRHALAGFLEVNAARLAPKLHLHISADHGFQVPAHCSVPICRGNSSTALT